MVDKADKAAAHRQCARDADALKSEDGKLANISLDGFFLTKISEAENWRCLGCVANALEPEVAMADATASLSARRSSAPKLAGICFHRNGEPSNLIHILSSII